MALSSSALSTLIVSNLSAQGFDVNSDKCSVQKLADAMADAVVAHIKSAGAVSVAGITPGSSIATGTIT